MAVTLTTVRLLIDDVDEDFFTDAQIQVIADIWDDDYLTAAAMLDIMAVSATIQAKIVKAGRVTVDRSQLPRHFQDIAKQYRKNSDEGPAVAIAERNWGLQSAAEIFINKVVRDG